MEIKIDQNSSTPEYDEKLMLLKFGNCFFFFVDGFLRNSNHVTSR